jgi:hypothetical protein
MITEWEHLAVSGGAVRSHRGLAKGAGNTCTRLYEAGAGVT